MVYTMASTGLISVLGVSLHFSMARGYWAPFLRAGPT